MSKRNAEAETADGIPDEPKEKTAKLEANLNATTDEETPLLDADVEAIKHAAAETENEKDEHHKNDEVEEGEEDIVVNGVEPIIDEPDDEEGHQEHNNHVEAEEEEEEEIVQNAEGEEEKEEEDEIKKCSPAATEATELPEDVGGKDDDDGGVEFKVPHLPTKIHASGDADESATTSASEAKDGEAVAEQNGST